MSIAFYINLLLSLSFLLVTILVLKKSHNISNIAFSWTTALFSLSTFFGLVEELYADQLQAVPNPITVLDNFIFPLAPLGLVFSAFIIKNGYSSWKNISLWLLTIIYAIIENILFAGHIRYLGDYSYLNSTMNQTIWNALLLIPLMASVLLFFLIHRDMDEEKNKMLIVILGVSIGTFGQLLNVIGIVTINNDLVLFSYLIVVIGVLLISFAFMNITNNQTRSAQAIPN